MNNYNRIMLGRKSGYAEESFKGNFIVVDYDQPMGRMRFL